VTKALAAAAILWPVLLVAGTASRIAARQPWLTATVYAAAGTVCHQRPDRSFHTHGARWPVCARCSGLYLAAPVGAIVAAASRRRLRRARDLRVLAIAALPTVVSFVLEHAGLTAVTSAVRFVAALPLGAALAWVVVSAATGPERSIE
jgi:uncharacterized membrane protein